MSEENKPEEVADVATQTTETQVAEATEVSPPITKVGEIDKTNETIDVDLFGISVTLPVDKAKELIAKRQEKTNEYKQLTSKLDAFQTEKQQLADKLKIEQLAKDNKLAELESVFTEKLHSQVSKYRSKIVDAELTRCITSHPEFIGGEDALKDALVLIKAQTNFDLDDSDQIKAGDKSITEIVSEFIGSRDVFKKASRTVPNSSRPSPIKADRPKATLSDGLEQFFKK